MKIRNIALIILIALVSINIQAQEDEPQYKSNPFSHILKSNYIKFSPFQLLELEPSFMIGYEYPIKKMRLQHEIGYVGLFNPAYDAFLDWGTDFSSFKSNGLKVRTTFKFPLKSNNLAQPIRYIGIDIMYKYLTWTQSNVSVWRMNAFTQSIDINSEKHVGAIHMLYGINNYVSNIDNIIADYYFGIGIRFKSLTNDLTADILTDYEYPFWDNNQGVMISMMAGFKFGFGI